MYIISSPLDCLNIQWENCVITLGDFEGLHRGHQELISSMMKTAKKLKLPGIVVTYSPSPKKVLGKNKSPFDLYTQEEKISILRSYKIDGVIFLKFDYTLSQLTASKFLQNVLLSTLRASHITIGYDHCFGRNRHGHYTYLKLASKRYKFTINQIHMVSLLGNIISSSSIKTYIKQGRIELANRIIGRHFHIQAPVIPGKQRGKTLLGIPTANLDIPVNKLLPSKGVYACCVKYQNKLYQAVLNIGTNPTFDNTYLSVEVHIMNFEQDIYGKIIEIFFLKYLRKEIKFSNITSLKKQMMHDKKQASKINIPSKLK